MPASFESAYTSRQQSQAGSALARRAPALGPSRSRGAETRHASRTDRPAPASQCPVDWSQRILAEALDTLNLAVLATSASGQLLFANRPAQQILRTRDGLQLTPQGALETSRPTGRASLLEMIAAVGLHAPSETSVPDSPLLIVKRPMGRRPLTLVIQALHTSPPSVDPAAASVVVFAADPDRRLGAAEAALRQLHGITSREARLAGLLMEGHTLEDCCQDLSIQTSTARMHLGSLFSKTGTQRQSQLVAHLLSSLGLLRNPVASACESLPGLLASASPRIERMNVGGIAPGFAVLDCLEVGVAVVDASRQLCFVNRVAQRFMAECIGLQGHGSAPCASPADFWQSLLPPGVIVAGNRHGAQADTFLALSRKFGKRPLTVMIRRVASFAVERGSERASCHLIFILDPQRPMRVAEEGLRQLYGFTPCEARLANLLIEGNSLDACCEQLQIRASTARMHLSNLFAKTGVQRQGQLISLLVRTLGMLPVLDPGDRRSREEPRPSPEGPLARRAEPCMTPPNRKNFGNFPRSVPSFDGRQ